MVSMSLDFYELRNRVRREIISRIEEVSAEIDPVDFGWLMYALRLERDNPIFLEKVKELKRWAYSENSGKRNRDLGALSLALYLLKDNEKNSFETLREKIKLLIRNNINKSPITKFSVLNDPGQLFCVSLVSDFLEESYKRKLVEVIIKNINGSPSRRVLFVAAALNFGVGFKELERFVKIEKSLKKIEDVITLVWFLEKYRTSFEFDEEIARCWTIFEKMYPQVETEGNLLLSNRDLAFLYEATLNEIKTPNPTLIFNLYPFEDDLRKISEIHFKNKRYSSAVLQAILKLKEFIENISGISDPNEVNLIRRTMAARELVNGRYRNKNPEEIIIQFNEFLNQPSGRNEQEGLALIAEGIIKAFRHPRGHTPEDSPLLQITPYEALALLITIDYLWKRIKAAKIGKNL